MIYKIMQLCDYDVADTPFKRIKGIMFIKKQKKPLLFIFPKESRSLAAIHSFFCPVFDAVYLNSNKRVVDLFPSIPPFTISITPKKPAKYLIEAPAGFITKEKIKIGDSIEF